VISDIIQDLPANIWLGPAYQHPLPWALDLPPITLCEILMRRAADMPDAPALHFLGRNYSYGQLAQGVRRVAAGLQAIGVKKGDRIGLFLPNVPHYVAAYYGIMLAGATVVNFSPLYTVDELAAQVADSGTKILVTISAAALLPNALKMLEASALERLIVGSIAGVLPRLKSMAYRAFKRRDICAIPADPRITRFSELIDNPGKPAAVPIDAEADIALLQYSGGTTGVPKGAMLSHQNLSANARQVNAIDPKASNSARPQEDRILGVLPFFHVFANTCVLNRTIVNGGQIIMLPRFDAGQALAAVGRHRITAMPGVPTMYQAMLDHADLAKADFSSLRACISGGAPMPSAVRMRFEAVSGSAVVEGYGLTESSGVVCVNPYEGRKFAGSIGQPLPCTTVLLVDREDPGKLAQAGEPGEIVVFGPQVMCGYWNRPEAQSDAFVTHGPAKGALRTGDVGMIDADGFIHIVDRLKDMISVGGFKVFPSQIEAILYKHPAVKEALVIGLPDAYRGEVPAAFITLKDDAVPDEPLASALRDWANAQLGKHERLARVFIRDALPKTMIGKLDRKGLRAQAAAEDLHAV
jgi:long-chain acyl-CoA synthetase